jgi:transketolase
MNYAEVATDSRKRCLKSVARAKSPHIGSALSCIDLVTFIIMKYFKSNSLADSGNQFILSKGHAAIALYSVLTSLGKISEKDLESFCEDGSQFYGHINHLAHPLIELSTGSLGHGMPYGVGLAHANLMNKERGLVFVLMSDGELDEGTTWESALITCSHLNLLKQHCL